MPKLCVFLFLLGSGFIIFGLIVWCYSMNKKIKALEKSFVFLHKSIINSDVINESLNRSLKSPLN